MDGWMHVFSNKNKKIQYELPCIFIVYMIDVVITYVDIFHTKGGFVTVEYH